jgi:hypothetical protein
MPKPVSIPTTTQSLGSLLKSAGDDMRKDKGLKGDLDRLPMLTWIMVQEEFATPVGGRQANNTYAYFFADRRPARGY